MSIDSIRRKSGIRYRARIVLPNGLRASKSFKRKVDAQNFDAEMRTNGESKLYREERARISFTDFADTFLQNHVSTLEFSTQEKYRAIIQRTLIPRFGKFWIDEIKTLDVAKFRAELDLTKMSGSSKNAAFITLKSVLKKAFEWEITKSIPGAGIKAPRKGQGRSEHWSRSEVAQFLFAMATSPRLNLYLVALNTGMRAGEIFGLLRDSVNFDNGIVDIKRSYCQKKHVVKETNKTHRTRFIKMNPVVRRCLLQQMQLSKTNRIFNCVDIGCANTSHLARVLSADCKKAGVRRIRFHDLRHTYATNFVSGGGSIHEIANVLGHSTVAMTSRYAHFSAEQAEKAASVICFDIPEQENVVQITNGHKVVTTS